MSWVRLFAEITVIANHHSILKTKGKNSQLLFILLTQLLMSSRERERERAEKLLKDSFPTWFLF